MNNEGKIPKTKAMIFIGVAIFFDSIQALINLIPGEGQVLSIITSFIAYMTFYLMFKLNGLKFYDRKSIVFPIIEAIPVINILPSFTAMTVRRIATIKAEEVVNKVPMANTAINKVNSKTIFDKKPSVQTQGSNKKYLSDQTREKLFDK